MTNCTIYKSLLTCLVVLWCTQSFAHGNARHKKQHEALTAYSRPYVDSLNEKALELAPTQTQEAIRIGNKALRISERISYDEGKIHALNNLGIINRNEGNYSRSMNYSRQALRIAYQSDKASLIGRSYYNLGDLHKILGNYDKAMSYFKQAFDLFNRSKEYEPAIRSLSNFAHCNMDKGKLVNDTTYFYSAIKYYKASLQVARHHHFTQREIVAFINLSNAYNVFGQAAGNKKYIGIALAYSLKSLEMAGEHGFPSQKAISLNNLGEIMESYNNPQKAVEYYKQSLDLYTQLREYNRVVDVSNRLGAVYVKLQQYSRAIEAVKNSIALSEAQRFKIGLQQSYYFLGEVYTAKKDYAAALNYYQRSNKYRDSLAQEKNLIAIAGLQLEFESEQKDHEIALLNKEKLLKEQAIDMQGVHRNFLIGGCCLLFGLLVFVYRGYHNKKKTTLQILKAKEEAEKAKEIQEQFLTNTSHEIRTPMNGIIGMTQHLLDSRLNADQRQYVSVINESASNLMVIINDLLDMSKIKAGKMSFDEKPFVLPAMLNNISILLESKTKEKGIVLKIETDPGIPETLLGDKVRIQQVLLNLAGNAVKFTETGEVCIRIEQLPEHGPHKICLQFSVCDTGIGIPAGQLENIFENFTQVDGKTTRKQGGTGLGLAISKQLVEQMGGTISVSSTEGEGSVFSVILSLGVPLMEKPIAILQEKPADVPVENKLAGLSILVVDDNKINRQVARLSLEKWGMHVALAEGGKEALAFLKTNRNIDLVLMDVLMPDMDGFETTLQIRKNFPDPLCHLPIVAMTASAIHGERDKCLQSGMNDYISKPFNPGDLFDLLSKHISPEMLQRKRPATNFTHLHEKADGNNDFLIDIMETYVTEMPEYLVELNYQVIQADLKNIRAQVHKMKSPAALFGANELKEHLQFIELNIEQKGLTAEIKQRMEAINDLCRRTIDETNLELKKLARLVR